MQVTSLDYNDDYETSFETIEVHTNMRTIANLMNESTPFALKDGEYVEQFIFDIYNSNDISNVEVTITYNGNTIYTEDMPPQESSTSLHAYLSQSQTIIGETNILLESLNASKHQKTPLIFISGVF